MKKIAFAAAIATAVAGMAAPASATEFVKNGGFETASRTGNFELTKSGTVSNWTSNGGYNLLFDSAIATTVNAAGTYTATGKEKLWGASASSQGGNFAALDGNLTDRGALTQLIEGLEVGKQYVLSFEWAAGQLQSRTGATTEQLQYSLGSDVFTTEVLNNASQGFTGWKTVSRTFTASSTSELLSFLSIGTPVGLPPIAMLDNVSLTAAVPEPATWAMMLVGFGMVGASARYRRRNVRAVIA